MIYCLSCSLLIESQLAISNGRIDYRISAWYIRVQSLSLGATISEERERRNTSRIFKLGYKFRNPYVKPNLTGTSRAIPTDILEA